MNGQMVRQTDGSQKLPAELGVKKKKNAAETQLIFDKEAQN